MSDSNKQTGNILLVANWKSDVGYAWWLMENFWAAISSHFEKRGIHCHLIYPEINGIPETIQATGIETHEIDFADHSIRNLLAIYRLIKTNNIRHIYLSDAPASSPFYIILRFFGIRNIVIHDHTPGDRTVPSSLHRVLKSISRRLPWINADHFIAVTDFVCRRSIEVSCIPAEKCSVATNGIHPIDLQKAPSGYAQKTLSIPADRQIIVTTGRAAYYKGIDFFILCADELINRQNISRLHFLFCGDGPDLETFKSLCTEKGLDDYFTFAGKRSDIRDILPSCNIGFHTSKGEVGYSLSILEYMSAGLATIVPDRPSTSGATNNDVSGLIYQAENINDACDAIKKCLHDDFRQKLAEAAIKDINKRFNINNTNRSLLAILDRIYT